MNVLLRFRALLAITSLTLGVPDAARAAQHEAVETQQPSAASFVATPRDGETQANEDTKETDPPAAPAVEDDDMSINHAQPDFTVVNLPTNLRLPAFKSAFRVTHRFTRALGDGDFGDLASDFFSLDNGAIIGLEYRFGLMRGLQIGIHRTSDKTIEFFGQRDLLRQSANMPLGLSVVLSVEGLHNFKRERSPAIGVVLSRELGEHGALYVMPMWVGNTGATPQTDDSTGIVGLGARVRIRPTVYLVGELTPRATGFKPGVNHGTFAVEKQVGGHVFQINFSNSFGTTFAQIARGGLTNDNWYLGFNISRKFY